MNQSMPLMILLKALILYDIFKLNINEMFTLPILGTKVVKKMVNHCKVVRFYPIFSIIIGF